MPPYPWQQALWDSFVGWMEKERLAHALLIGGPEGLGGLAMAQAMAHYLLCHAPMGPIACGKCRGCQLVVSETHPDLQVLQPEGTSALIKIDQVRQMTEFLTKTAQQGGRKVVVLAPAEAMNHNAANALLKNLEEPSKDTFLLLVSPEPSRLLATIRSRCAKLTLTVPQADQAAAWLEKAGISSVEQLLADAGGEPLKVQRWYEQDFPAQQERMQQDLEDLTAGKRSPLGIAKAWLEYGPVEAVDSLIVWVQSAIKRNQTGVAEVSRHKVAGTLSGVPAQLLFRYRDKLIHCKKQLLSQNNPNLELLLDELLLDWAAMCRQTGSRR